MWERRRHIVSRSFKRDTLYCVACCMWESRHLLDTQGIPVFQQAHLARLSKYLLDTCACSALYFILWEGRHLLDTRGIPVICWMEVLAQSIHGKGQQGGTRKKCWSKRYLLLIAPIGYVEKHKWKG